MEHTQTHELKCWPEYFDETWEGNKPFELRKDDRNFQLYDRLLLREWDPETEEYSGRTIDAVILYVLIEGPWLVPGFVAMGIDILGKHGP